MKSARRVSQWEKSAGDPRVVEERHSLLLVGSIRVGSDGRGDTRFFVGDDEVPSPKAAELDLVSSEGPIGQRGSIIYAADEAEPEASTLCIDLLIPKKQWSDLCNVVRTSPPDSIAMYLAFSSASNIPDEILRFDENGVAVQSLDFECFKFTANLFESNDEYS